MQFVTSKLERNEDIHMEESLVSVIITNYNYAHYLPEAIQSVLNQTYQNFEIIIVDDGSKDESVAVLEKYEAEYPTKIQVVYKENGGQGSAFNAGFELATGDIVAFLDADDYWYENKLETIVHHHKKHAGIQHNLLINNEIPFVLLEDQVEKQKRLLEDYGSFGTIPTSGLSFIYEQLKPVFPVPIEYRICADLYIKMFFLNEGNDIFSLNEAFANYRHHDNNLWYNNQGVTSDYNEMTLVKLNEKRNRDGKALVERLAPAKIYVEAGLNLHTIDPHAKIGIYGTGAIGQEVYNRLKSNNYTVQFFTDSSSIKEGLILNDVPLIPFHKVEEDEESYDLMIIASSAQTEIMYDLKRRGFPSSKYRGLYL